MRIHFIGVGKMGLPMACHLHSGGHALTVSDPDPARLELARAAGLDVLPLAAGALHGVEMVFSSLPHDDALLAVAHEIARCAPGGGLIHVDTSTVSPAASAQAAGVLALSGIDCLRCTVSGNNHLAQAAQLTVMASGPRPAWQRAEPLLRLFGPNLFYLGEAEQARLMKLIVNLMIVQTSAMLGEALTLGRKGGLDWESMWEVITASAVSSPIVKTKSQQLSQRDFTPTFTVRQMVKDLDLILAAGAAHDAPLAQTALTRQWMAAALAQGFGEQDYAALIKTVEHAAGLSDEPPLTTHLKP